MKSGRLHIRIDEQVAKKAREYAKARRTTVTQLVEQYLQDLIESEDKLDVEPAEQI
jgi:predicted HicB family RNase H-like nuclease